MEDALAALGASALGRAMRGSLWLYPAANAAHEKFRTAILVEQDGPRFELLRLRSKEVHHHRLARTRRADDREIAQVAVMEIEEERG